MPLRSESFEEADDEIVQEILIEASPATVFSYLVDADKFTRWMGMEAALDARPGGAYRVRMNQLGETVAGTFVVVETDRRVVFTWGWEGAGSPLPPGTSRVEVTLEPQGTSTLVRLRHTGFRGRDHLRGLHAQGWAHYLPRLGQAGEGRDPGFDPWIESNGPPHDFSS